MKRSVFPPAFIAVLLAASGAARAQDGIVVLSVNFGDAGTAMGAGMEAGIGAARRSNWNNATGDAGTLAGLNDDKGAATDVSMTWSCQDEEITAITGGTEGDQKMMSEGARSWREANGGAGVNCRLVFSNLLSVYDPPYKVYVYIGRGGGWPSESGNSFTLTVGAGSLSGWTMAVFDGTWDMCAGDGDVGNWCVMSGNTDDTIQVDMVAGPGKTLNTAAVNGIQIYGTKKDYIPGAAIIVR